MGTEVGGKVCGSGIREFVSERRSQIRTNRGHKGSYSQSSKPVHGRFVSALVNSVRE